MTSEAVPKADDVVAALEVITADPVKAILFNIFGGITRGGEVAQGLLEALERMDIDVPIVVRIDGTEAEEGDGSSPTRRRANVARRSDHAGRGTRVVESRGASRWRSSSTSGTRLVVQGITGREGTSTRLRKRLRNQRRRRRHARKRRRRRRRHSRVRRGARCGRTRPRRTPRWCSCRPGSPPTPSTRRWTRASRRDRDHGGHPGPRHAARLQLRATAGRDAGRPELPGRPLAGKANVGIIPAEIFSAGPSGS